jgi:hypothetical protein
MIAKEKEGKKNRNLAFLNNFNPVAGRSRHLRDKNNR